MGDGNVSSSPCCRVSRSLRSSADSCLTNGSARVLVVGFHDLSDLSLLKPYTGRSTWLLGARGGRETGRWACKPSVTLSYVCLLRDSVTRLTFQREVEPTDALAPVAPLSLHASNESDPSSRIFSLPASLSRRPLWRRRRRCQPRRPLRQRLARQRCWGWVLQTRLVQRIRQVCLVSFSSCYWRHLSLTTMCMIVRLCSSNVFFSRSKFTSSPVKSAASSSKGDGGTLSISQSLGAGMNPRHLDQAENDSSELFKKRDSSTSSKQVRSEPVNARTTTKS